MSVKMSHQINPFGQIDPAVQYDLVTVRDLVKLPNLLNNGGSEISRYLNIVIKTLLF